MEKHTIKAKSYAFFCPQGTLLLKDNLYIRRQGSTAENGGQVIYAVEIAKAVGQLSHCVDIYARNYGNADFEVPQETMIETMPDCPNVRIIHVPSSADETIEKEHFYPYYNEYLTHAFKIIQDKDYDYIIGHYVDGMFMAVVVEEMMFRLDDRRRATLGITHSLGQEKAECLLTKIKAEATRHDATNRVFYLREEYRRAAEAFNLGPRHICELAAIQRLDGIMPVSYAHFIMLCDKYDYPKDKMQIVAGGVNQDVFHLLNYTVEEKYFKRADLIQDYIDIIGEHRREILQNGKIVLGFGRLVVAKGIIEAVKSMEYLTRDIPEVVYVYIGGNIPPRTAEEKDVYKQSLDHARLHGYEDRIFFIGRGDQNIINEWLNVSDIYLHAAHLEPFGLAPQEAAATQIPVVMSKKAGVCDVLRDKVHVLYVEPLQPQDIAKQVKRLLKNKHLAESLAQRAAAIVVDESTWIARARTMDKFCMKINDQYVIDRTDALKVQIPFDDATRNLLFQKPDTMVLHKMRPIYGKIRSTMEDILSSRLIL